MDFYEVIAARHRRSSFIITSNQAVEEWIGLFEGPILANGALGRLTNNSCQITIEGTSCRERLSPHGALLKGREVTDPPTLDQHQNRMPGWFHVFGEPLVQGSWIMTVGHLLSD